CVCFFFQAEDGIRDRNVTGVQTCALPISDAGSPSVTACRDGEDWVINGTKSMSLALTSAATVIFARTDPDGGRGNGISAFLVDRSEERRGGNECRTQRSVWE